MNRNIFGLILLHLSMVFISCDNNISYEEVHYPPIGLNIRVFRQDVTTNGDWIDRFVYYFIPSSYEPEGTPMPILFTLHGSGGNGPSWARETRWDLKYEEEGFILIAPSSLYISGTITDPVIEGCGSLYPFPSPWQNRQWNSIPHRTHSNEKASILRINDIEFWDEMYNYFTNNFNVDKKRVYVDGLSNGAEFAYSLAISRGDKIAGISVSCMGVDTSYINTSIVDDSIKIIMCYGSHDFMGIPADVIGRTADYFIRELGIIRGGGEYGSKNVIRDWARGTRKYKPNYYIIDWWTEPIPDLNYYLPREPDGTVIVSSNVHKYEFNKGINGGLFVVYEVDNHPHAWLGSPRASNAIGAEILFWDELKIARKR